VWGCLSNVPGGANAGLEAGLPPWVSPSAAVLAAYLAAGKVLTVAWGAGGGAPPTLSALPPGAGPPLTLRPLMGCGVRARALPAATAAALNGVQPDASPPPHAALAGFAPPPHPLTVAVPPLPPTGTAGDVPLIDDAATRHDTVAAAGAPVAAARAPCGRFRCLYPGCGSTSPFLPNARAHVRVGTNELPIVRRVGGCGKRLRWASSISYHRKRHERLARRGARP